MYPQSRKDPSPQSKQRSHHSVSRARHIVVALRSCARDEADLGTFDSIIAITGLAGHAYGSWAHADDRMWLRDYLKDTNARILTYGYESNMDGGQSSNWNTIQDHAARLWNRLTNTREDNQVSIQI